MQPPVQRLLSLDMPFARFAWRTILVSLAGLVPLLALYVALTPGFGAALAGGGPALSLFLRQVVTNGLPVVLAVNYVAFVLFAALDDRPGRGDAVGAIAIDMAARLVLFVALHAAIYVASARAFGSFGGSPATALGVVAPTLARAAHFENVSGVYLYATLVSALPLYAAAVSRSRVLGPLADRLPGRSGPWLLAVGFFGLFALVLTLGAGVAGLRAG
ncbi:MAG: hypothetical protein ACTS11_08610 [Roseicyclus sp.]